MIRTITTRFPPAHIVVYPVKVQGEGAAEEVAAAIAHLNLARPDVDVIIAGRGGGSLEDLWAFNEEVVARAIFASRIPVVSAVGHETDFTISDFVADVRALTPTDAGNRVVPKLDDLLVLLEDSRSKLRRALRQRAELAHSQLDGLQASYALRQPVELVRQQSQRLDELAERLRVGLGQASANLRERLAHREQMMRSHLAQKTQNAAERLKGLAGRLESLSPLAVLARGYSITQLEEKILRDAKEAKPGDRIVTRLAKGTIISDVQETRP
jgi:exodeoxyribonuclease VII large subunit